MILTDITTSRWHYVVVVVPHNLKFTDAATLYITGGSNTDGYPGASEEDNEICAVLAVTNGVICTVLFQIPNQPIVFADDPSQQQRSEDALIAWCWHHFIMINSSEPFWLPRLPMVKAAVRTMDTIQTYVAQKFGHNIEKFVVAGASKRGWTTWLTGAVDTRVVGIIPIVMDALDFVENVHHFWRAYGGWTFALSDYYVLNFTMEIDLPNTALMASIIDPVVYASRLTMPKLVIDAGGDEFFMLDDNHFWYNQMAATGETHLLMVQDAEHSMATGLEVVLPAATAFTYAVLTGTPRPTMTWEWYNGTEYGNITLYTSELPLQVNVWHADTIQTERRDWRLVTGQNPCPTITISGDCLQPVLWYRSSATAINDTTYTVTFDAPEEGWRAFFITVSWVEWSMGFKDTAVHEYEMPSDYQHVSHTATG